MLLLALSRSERNRFWVADCEGDAEVAEGEHDDAAVAEEDDEDADEDDEEVAEIGHGWTRDGGIRAAGTAMVFFAYKISSV